MKMHAKERILIVSALSAATQCAEQMSQSLGATVDLAPNRRAAVSSLRRQEYSVVLMDDALAEADGESAELIWGQAGLAVPMQVNFAISGCARVLREVHSALLRRNREQAVARRAAAKELEADLGGAVTGILLELDLALASPQIGPEIAARLRSVSNHTQRLRSRLVPGFVPPPVSVAAVSPENPGVFARPSAAPLSSPAISSPRPAPLPLLDAVPAGARAGAAAVPALVAASAAAGQAKKDSSQLGLRTAQQIHLSKRPALRTVHA